MTSTPPGPDQPSYPGSPAPQEPFGAGGYPRHPGTPSGESAPGRSTVPQPVSIATAVKLMYVGAAVSLLGLVVTFATLNTLKDDVREQLLKSDPGASQSTVDGIFAVAIGFAVVFTLVGAGLWVWMAVKNGQGRSWARVVATVLGAVNVLSTLYSAASGQATGLSVAVSLVGVVLAAVILVLLWRKESSEFYAASSAR